MNSALRQMHSIFNVNSNFFIIILNKIKGIQTHLKSLLTSREWIDDNIISGMLSCPFTFPKKSSTHKQTLNLSWYGCTLLWREAKTQGLIKYFKKEKDKTLIELHNFLS